jgi:hypothetical protein
MSGRSDASASSRNCWLRIRVCWGSSGGYRGRGQVDHGGKALVCLAGVHGNAFEHLDLAEEVFDEMPPFVHLLVEDEGFARRGCWEMTTLAPRVEFGDKGVAVERLVGDQRVEGGRDLPACQDKTAPSSPIGRQSKRIGPSAT